MNEDTRELMLDLLCKQAVYGLTEDEKKQLSELRGEAGPDEAASLEATAAMISVVGLDPKAEMPPHLLAKVSDSADEYFGALPSGDGRFGKRSDSAVVPAAGRSFLDWFGWVVAAAACVALALNIYFTRLRPAETARVDSPTPPVAETLTPAQQRERLIQTAPDLARATWAGGGKEFQQVAGDVVWSDQKQSGYVRLTGLPSNDPSRSTYQLWMFEENQGEKTPIDGGTFDVSANGEVIIPVNARLKAKNPKMFAVTVEKPGGTVVSKREKIAAIAKVET